MTASTHPRQPVTASPAPVLSLEGAKICTPQEVIPAGRVVVAGKKIIEVSPLQDGLPLPNGALRVTLEGMRIIPGLIDTHTHGGFGHDFMACNERQAKAVLQGMARHGVTSVIATISTCQADEACSIFKRLLPLIGEDTDGAQLLGFHLEGPYIHPEKAGAQPREAIRHPDIRDAGQLLEGAGGAVRIMTLAPELPNALDLIQFLVSQGVVASVGHSTATYDQMLAAAEAGASRVAHTFNGMTPLHHRSPGIPGAALTCDELMIELIADGHHVHPAVMDIILRCRGPEHVILISDSNQAAGLPEGEYIRPGNRKIRVKDGAAWLQNGSLAGSVLNLKTAVLNLVRMGVAPFEDAVRMASGTPAASLGLAHTKGSVEAGFDADLVVMDQDEHVIGTFVAGGLVYARPDGPLAHLLRS